ncbi:UDP-glucosyltransferase 2-like [Macrobrachium rosenbergii]|uniref:UDP-glucosyltransferase 2-like n=1 Tax=Macrobrachium rosenbergii TaxID=79674 RepID=UPI0034D54BD4
MNFHKFLFTASMDKMKKILIVLLMVTKCAHGKDPPEKHTSKTGLAPSESHYKILMLLPVSTPSHRIIFLSLAKGLADRGHKVVMLTNNNSSDDRLVTENIYEFSHGVEELHQVNVEDLAEMKWGVSDDHSARLLEVFDRAMNKLYASAEINELYRKRKRFDLIILHAEHNEVMFPFVHEMNFITIAPEGLDYRQSAQLGNPLNPAYVPFVYSTKASPMGLLQRVWNAWNHLAFSLYWDVYLPVPSFQKMLLSKFPNLPPLLDIEKNQSLTLSNSHFSIGTPTPLLPSQVEIAGMQCYPMAEPLPHDLQEWIDESSNAGVIYVNLGSFAPSSSMNEDYLPILLEAFNRIRQRVIWRYEDLPNLPKNVITRSWCPQQDILGHPKIKAFLTHGGILSSQEAVYHGKPLLAIPSTLEQTRNSKTIVEKGVGISIPKNELISADQIVDGILDLLQDNSKYQKNMAELSASFRDQIHTPLERAIFWTEYAIRNPGVAALKSPAAQLSWREFLLLDIIAIFLVIIFLIPYLVSFIVKRCFAFVMRKLFRREEMFSLPTSAKQKMN